MPPNDPSNTFTQDLTKYQAINPKLTVTDIQVYNMNKSNYFAGTIAVCVIYGAFCLALLLLTIYSPSGSQLITETFRLFTITFIIGMLIAIGLLTWSVLAYKPSEIHKDPYDSQICPDYWEFQQTDPNNLVYKDAIKKNPQNQYIMNYQCVNTNKVGNNNTNNIVTSMTNPSTNKNYTGTQNDPVDIRALYTYTTSNTAYNQSSSLNCSEVYPILLNSVNSGNSEIKNIPNALACDYAQQCGISWSAMCPNGQTNASF